ncbi:hypothetical protein RND71_014834 [Anisodus tanguticus]|uniref:Peptidase S1 domain-containing protein n=1 Tax=Anisodus tanguticus TaxID=243964 RepID=A0AAE1VN38_9SOLA|nr:hypothetical protein RND71_014834 [Anisodus tanguticus]
MLRIGSTLRTERRLLNRQLHFQCPIVAGDSSRSSIAVVPMYITGDSSRSIIAAAAEENDSVESDVSIDGDAAGVVDRKEEFWEGMNSLELGDVPFLQEAVAVVGYPQGVVSRVEPTQYVHGASQLLAIQIDAAINPGNSGGPAIMGDKVAGVAFQNLSGAENIR